MRSWLPALVLALVASPAFAEVDPATPQDGCPPGNLLAGKAPTASQGVTFAQRITDGIAPEEGDEWRSSVTAILGTSASSVTWDLGRTVTVNSLLIQADNNDTYTVEASTDGQTFAPLWTAPMHPNPGMRMRLQQGLDAQLRYLRIGQARGDNAFSLGEVQAFCQHPSPWPPALERTSGAAPKGPASRKVRMSRGKMMLGFLGALAFLGLFLSRKGEDLLFELIAPTAAGGAILYAGWMTAKEAERRAPGSDSLAWEKRGLVIAGVLVALMAAALAWRHLKGRSIARWAERSALTLLMFASAVSWVNFGTFHGSRVVHYWDTFHYYMGAKYFEETGYTLLYHCSGVGEIDDGRKAEFEKRQLRDLRDNRLGDALPALEDDAECRAAFTPERWAAFREDLRLFRQQMGSSWWGKMFKDHGYNATPVWNMVGNALAGSGWRAHIPPAGQSTATNELAKLDRDTRNAVLKTFRETRVPAFQQRIYKLVALDFLLYLGIFLSLLWAFGLRAAALAMVVWGAGYPWAYFWTGGGFGRVPWLFTATVGLSLLKKGYPLLGGFGLTWSALLRVFPGALVIGISLKIATEVFKGRSATHAAAEPAPEGDGLWAKAQRRFGRSHLRFVIGCFVAVGTLIPASLPSSGGFEAYPHFLENSLKHKATPLTNHMGLPTLLSYHPERTARHTKQAKADDPFGLWKTERKRTLKERRWLHAGLLLLFMGLLAYVGRRLTDWEVTALSVVFMIGIFELTCYYYSFVVLLAPFALRRWHYVFMYLGMAVVTQWFQHVWGWYDEQYTWETAAVLGPVFYLLAHTAWQQYRGTDGPAEALAPSAAPDPAPPTAASAAATPA